MAQILGRELRPDEVVRHLDGDKENDDPNNLQVMTRAECTRQQALLWHQKRRERGESWRPRDGV